MFLLINLITCKMNTAMSANLTTVKNEAASVTDSTSINQTFVSIACISFFPMMYFIGKTLMALLG